MLRNATCNFFAVVTLLLGLVVTYVILDRKNSEEETIQNAKYETLDAEHSALVQRLQKTRSQNELLQKQNRELASDTEALREELEAERALAAAREIAAAEPELPEIPIAFGEWSELEAFRNADWQELGDAVLTMNDLILAVVQSVENGEPVDPKLQEKIRQENTKLVKLAAGIMGKIPTHSPVNGEYSHPIALANLMGAMLDNEEMPLSEGQLEQIRQLGNAYEDEYAARQASYNDDTPRLQKLIDELELKRDTINGMQGTLSDQQRELVVHPETHHRLQVDPLSPFTMAVMLAKPKEFESASDLRKEIPKHISKAFDLQEEASGALDGIVDSWLQDLEPILKPTEGSGKFVHVDQAVIAGRAQARAFEQLLALPDLSDAARTKILHEISWGIPMVKEKPH